jgi:hypothetical protein
MLSSTCVWSLCQRSQDRARRDWCCLQLLGLPRRQDLAHGDRGRRYMKLEAALLCLPSRGSAPDRGLWVFAAEVYASKVQTCRSSAVRRTRMLGLGWIVLDASSQAKTGQYIGIWQTKRSVCEVVLDDALPWRGDSWIAVADVDLPIY